jgi:hypothetical protein
MLLGPVTVFIHRSYILSECHDFCAPISRRVLDRLDIGYQLMEGLTYIACCRKLMTCDTIRAVSTKGAGGLGSLSIDVQRIKGYIAPIRHRPTPRYAERTVRNRPGTPRCVLIRHFKRHRAHWSGLRLEQQHHGNEQGKRRI